MDTLGALSFFHVPPPPDDEPEPCAAPPWFWSPQATLPGVVPIELVLAQSEKAAVYVTQIDAYPTGFELDVVRLLVVPDQAMLFDHQFRWQQQTTDGELPPELFRFGVEFADGTKATNIDRFPDGDDEPTGPVMSPRGSGSSGARAVDSYWIWPLPPSGPLALVCEWPAMDIGLTRHELDSQRIRDASKRALVVFSDREP